MLRAVTGSEVVAAPQSEQREAVKDEAEIAEASAVPAEEELANADITGEETGELAEIVTAALGAAAVGLSELADDARSVLADIGEGMGSLGDVSLLASVDGTSLSDDDALAIDEEEALPLSAMFAMALEDSCLERATEVAFELAGRVWEIEIVDMAADTIRAIEMAIFADTSSDTIELAGLDEDRAAGRGFDSGNGWRPGRVDQKPAQNDLEPGAWQDHDLGRTSGPEQSPPEHPTVRESISAILAEDRVVTETELDLLLTAFTEQVGDVGMARGMDSILFLDRSVTGHVQSRDIEATTVWLEDDTRVTFVGTVWDFDGFAT